MLCHDLQKKNDACGHTNINVRCIDNSGNDRIRLSYVNDAEIYVDDTPNLSARTYATLVIKPTLDEKQQMRLVRKFNKFLEKRRTMYNSLFMTNYRESKDIARKRISFELVYSIVGHILDTMEL